MLPPQQYGANRAVNPLKHTNYTNNHEDNLAI